MQVVPIQDIFNQEFQVVLAGQNCTINVYQLSTGLFCDLYVAGVLVIAGVICEDRNRIVRDLYLGFIGDLAFVDLQGESNPLSPGLGTRYVLIYLEASDLPAGQG